MNKLLIFALVSLCFLVPSNAQDLSEIYEKVSPSVVAIFTEEKTIITTENNDTQSVTNSGLGSGFMISDKLIVTAAHVIKVSERLTVQFSDGETIPAKVITAYNSADIALIELFRPKMNATTVKFGDSDSMKIGQRIFVIGVPLGVGFSMSSGYVSAIDKKYLGKNPFTSTEFIQTDAAINQGNSGGPMFNLNGEVVGIVSHIKTMSGGSDGIGYASSSNLASKLLLKNKMPWFGADLHSLTLKEAKLLNLPQSHGLLVQRVSSSSIFYKMGVKGGDIEATLGNQILLLGGDILVAFNDIEYDINDETLLKLAEFATGLSEGLNFNITIFREGKMLKLTYKE
jgi:serine protease Do